MSALIDFYTYEVMEGAIVNSVSSEATGHPAEHAIAPLEPDFAWEADEVDEQHTLVIDLGETRVCDGVSFIHHELETVTVDVNILVEKSSDATNWSALSLAFNSDGTDTPSDLTNTGIVIKLRHFTDGTTTLQPQTARYWRITVIGVGAPLFMPVNDARLSMCWLFNLHQLDRGAAFPVNDAPVYPAGDLQLPFGKIYRTGYSVNSHTPFTRVWMLTGFEYDVLREVMRQCNGAYRPFVLVGVDGTRKLCKFASDEINEELLDIGLYRVTCSFVELPIVKKDKYH